MLSVSVTAFGAYPSKIEMVQNGGKTEIHKVYELGADEPPSSIPQDSFEQDGKTYVLQDILKNEIPSYETREIIEPVTVESETNKMEDILPLIPAEKEVLTDDGFSGTNFDRPAFKRLISDIESGKVNCVITKDYSRLGRDYIKSGEYLEKYFPEHNVRYIAILDNIDTISDSAGNDIAPYRAILNDQYAKDISKKVRSAVRTKKTNGDFLGWKAIYGYKKDEKNKNKLVIDEEAAKVVRRIFIKVER